MKRNLLILIVTLLWSSTMWAADGDVFTAKTVEGVTMKFEVLSEADKICQVGRNGGYGACINSSVEVATIPEEINGYHVTAIGYQAFRGCKNLTTLNIPNSIDSIGLEAFRNCSNLTSITIPSRVTFIGKDAIRECPGLKKIIVENGNPVYDSRDNCNALINTSTNELIAGCMNTTIPDGVTVIGDNAFRNCTSLSSISLPNSVIDIKSQAFDGCTGLTSVEMSNRVSKIGYCAFRGCCSLTSITVPASVKDILSHAFENCSGLTSVTIPNGVTIIGVSTFAGCSRLTSLTIPESMEGISDHAFEGCSSLNTVTVRSINPVPTGEEVFSDETYRTAMLFVPKGRIADYKNAEIWKEFLNIEGVEMPELAMSSSKFYNLSDNQMILGYYTSNDSISTEYSTLGYGGYNSGTYKACISFSKEKIKPFVGNRITDMRFALLNTNITDVKLWIGSSRDKEDLYTQPLTTLKAGWNDVALDQPFEITEDSIVIGLEYQQEGQNFPLSCVPHSPEEGSCYLYGPYDEGDNMWLKRNISLSLQCLVEGDQLPLYDIHTAKLEFYSVSNSYKAGDEISAYIPLKNWGRNSIDKYVISCKIDGTEINTVNGPRLKGSIFDSEYINIRCNTKIPENIQWGDHELTMSVKSINDQTPVFPDDDSQSASFFIVPGGMGRQKVLIEHYTATWCMWCPSGQNAIERAMEGRDDVAFVSYHYEDDLSCSASDSYSKSFDAVFPLNYFDRFIRDGNESYSIDEAKYQPSYANVNIEAAYNTHTKTVDIKVYGQKCKEFDEWIGNTNLTVLLTEDGIITKQRDYFAESGYQLEYVHNDVLRTNVSAVWGDPVTWDGDRYEKAYSIRLDDSWVKDNMKIVAFLGKPFDGSNLDELHVVNCNDFALKDATTVRGGDANGDGTVNAADIVEVVNYIMGHPSEEFDEKAADSNGDGVVNAADIVEMVNIIMNTK